MNFTASKRWILILFTILSVVLVVYLFANDRYQLASPKPQIDMDRDGVFTVEDDWYICASFLAKVATAYLIVIVVSLMWFLSAGSKQLSGLGAKIADNVEGSQQLLLDLRDGTKRFYKDRRRSLRVRTDITAQLAYDDVHDYIKTIDLSYGGALLKTSRRLKVGDIVELDLFLPLFPQPVHIRVLVVRVCPDETGGQAGIFQVGVKYLEMPKDVRRKLIETLDALAKESPHKPRR